jgi:WD40 repeat protein/tRNA A-37 threonylcarbamoyl transferase component Bud32
LEELWQHGHRPDVHQFLADCGTLAAAELAAVLGIDQWQRWHAGERVPAEQYLDRYPALQATPELALDLVYGEFLVREELGEAPATAEFVRRFPRYAAQLQEQLRLHRDLESKAEPAVTQVTPSIPPALLQAAVPPDEVAPGLAMAGYEILGELGRGGMGVVYKARQKGLNRSVALKFMRWGAHASAQERARFRSEAEAVARLQHPNVVQVHEVGEQDGRPFLALEYLEGGSLARQLSGTPRPARAAAELVETLARAVHAAHGRNIVHRDLKPDNVLLAADGTPKIADFGLAKLLDDEQGQTGSGSVLGTPSYMAPEQAQGRTRDIGPATDVYALGAILYELLTGRPPFKAETPMDTVLQVISDEPVPPSRLSPKLPRDLETICLKCLEKGARKRYASAAALADDLRRFLAGKPVAVRPVGTAARVWRWGRRNPGWAAALACTAVLLVVIAVGAAVAAVWFAEERHKAQLAERQATQQREAAEANLRRAEQAERDQRQQLLRSYLAEARARRVSLRIGQRCESLEALGKAARLARELGLPELLEEIRTEATACLALPDLRVLKEWEGWPSGSNDLAFDGRLELYARTEPKRKIVSVRRVADDAEVLTVAGTGSYTNVLLSPDGRFLAVWFDSRRRFQLWDLQRKPPATVLDSVTAHATGAFSPDGKRLALVQSDGGASLYDLDADNKPLLLPKEVTGKVTGWAPAFDPQGKRLAVVSEATVRIFGVESGQLLRQLVHKVPVISNPAWRPDGRVLIVAGADRRIYSWDVDGEVQLTAFEGTSTAVALAFHPGGELAITIPGEPLPPRVWHAATGQQWLSVPNWLGHLAAFSQDGRRLAGHIHGTRQRLYEVKDGQEYRTLSSDLRLGKMWYCAATISPDGRLLAVPTKHGVRLWSLPAGRELAVLPTGPGSGWAHFEPQGTLLTGSSAGIFRWPLQAGGKAVRGVGPPKKLPFTGDWLASSLDGRVVFDPRALSVWRDGRSGKPLAIGPKDLAWAAVSPGGELVATIVYGIDRVTVWDCRSGEPVKVLPLQQAGAILRQAGFSPDGRWLAGTGTRTRLWKVGSWEEVPLPPGTLFAFSPDSRLLAIESDPGVLLLIEVATGRTVARLEAPNQDRTSFTFNHDGTQLIATSNDRLPVVHLWDLRLVRMRLKALGLDWGWPEFSPARPAPSGQARLLVDAGSLIPAFVARQGELPARTVERASATLRANPEDVEAYHRRGHAFEALRDYARAEADFAAALRRNPADDHLRTHHGINSARLLRYEDALGELETALKGRLSQADAATVCAELAWVRAAGPAKLRDFKEALTLAERAVGFAPANRDYRAVAALANYRLGHLAKARQDAEAGARDKGEANAFSLYVLALVHVRQRELDMARDCFTRGEAWVRANGKRLPPDRRAVLDALCAEVEAELARPGGKQPP